MSGIVPTVSTSSFKPLDLNEIMMVPLAKQKMEDDLLAGTGEVGEMEASTLGVDSEKANKILGGIKQRASDLSQEVIDRGVDRSQFNRLRKLRAESKKEFSSGFLGSAIANKKSASQFLTSMAKEKSMQAGWSPKEAQIWAQKQVSKFEGTYGEDGKFNSFSGQMLNNKVDYQKWINENLSHIESDMKSNGVSVGRLDSFRDLITLKKTDEKSFLKIMKSLKFRAQGDSDLKNSLIQEAMIYDRDPNQELDFGKSIFRKDKRGKEVEVWEPGKSSFGTSMVGAAYGASFAKDKSNEYIKDNIVAVEMMKKGMEKRKLNNMVRIGEGHVELVNQENIVELKESLDLAKDQVREIEKELSMIDDKESNTYKSKLANLNLAKSKLYNVDEIYQGSTKEARSKLGTSISTASDLSSEYIDTFGEGGMSNSQIYGAFRQKMIESGKEEEIDVLYNELYGMSEEDFVSSVGLKPASMTAIWMLSRGVLSKDLEKIKHSSGDIHEYFKGSEKKINKLSSEFLKQQKYSISHIDLGAMDGGTIDSINKNLSKNFDTASYSDPYTGQSINQYLQKEYYTASKEKSKKYPKGVKIESHITPGMGPKGEPLEKLIIRDGVTNDLIEQKYVTRGYGSSEFIQAARALQESDSSEAKQVGIQMENDYMFMPSIKRAGLRNPSKSGEFLDNIKVKVKDKKTGKVINKELSVSWTKPLENEDVWIISVSGMPDSPKLKSEKQVSNYLGNLFKKQ